ncbi:MAG: LCP family protein [Anaerolineae bacterium]
MAHSTLAERQQARRRRSFRIAISLLLFVLPFFVCGGVASGYYFYDTVRYYVANENLPDYGSVSPVNTDQHPVAMPTAVPAPNVTAGERINILLLGIDKRPQEQGPFRTDTMIIATFDPQTKTGGMLAIPRDLYVPIPYPGIGSDRINTANFYGDLYKYPGAGPGLAKKTIEYNLGVPIHYYVLIDFQGFKKIVDTLGGIDIDVAKAIHDDCYPTDNYGCEVLDIPAGHLHMNGDLALKYARARHTTNDFDRSKRQMQVILACREKALKLNMVSQIPSLWSQFQDTVHTDMTLPQMMALAPYGTQIRSDNIKVRAIDQSMTMEIILNNGADVLWPDRNKIAEVVNEMFPPAK